MMKSHSKEIPEDMENIVKDSFKQVEQLVNYLDGNISHASFLSATPFIFSCIIQDQELDLEEALKLLNHIKAKTLDLLVEDGVE